jgi:glutaredoxin
VKRVTIVLYAKPGCHLCEEARAAVHAVAARRDFELREVDVTLDPALHRRYGERVPVVEVAGEEVFELHVAPKALEEALDRVTA